MLWDASTTIGCKLLGSDGDGGTVSDLLFDDSSWRMRWIVMDTPRWDQRSGKRPEIEAIPGLAQVMVPGMHMNGIAQIPVEDMHHASSSSVSRGHCAGAKQAAAIRVYSGRALAGQGFVRNRRMM